METSWAIPLVMSHVPGFRVVEVLEEHFTTAGKLPCVVMSALRGTGTAELMPSVVAAYDCWNRR